MIDTFLADLETLCKQHGVSLEPATNDEGEPIAEISVKFKVGSITAFVSFAGVGPNGFEAREECRIDIGECDCDLDCMGCDRSRV